MATSVAQLRIGVTRDRGFLYRACIRPPIAVTVGRSKEALCPIEDPGAPELHTLFNVGGTSCILDFRREWSLTMYRDGRAVDGPDLIEEGTALVRGNRVLLKMGLGSRGALYFGSTRLLFKWEELAEDSPGRVPLRDIGEIPRCHACGQALADALAREGLLARCNSCRSMSLFVDPDSPYRTDRLMSAAEEEAHGSARRHAAHDVAPKEEAETLIGIPLFAPLTMTNAEPLSPFLRPAGVPSVDEPAPASIDPMTAAGRLQTVFDRPPFLGPRTARREEPTFSNPVRPSFPQAIKMPALRPPASAQTPTTTATTPCSPLRPPADEDLPSTELVKAAAASPTPAPDVVEAPAAAGEAPSAAPASPSAPPEVAVPASSLPMDPRSDEASSPSFWTDAISLRTARLRNSAEVPALDVAFYTSEVEALDWGRGASVVPWGTLTALSARADFEKSAGRIVLGPGQEPPPPSVTAIQAEDVAESNRLLVIYAVTALVSALAGAGIAILTMQLMG